jgi:predicted nuclease of predicted toxin-antitoxin system
MRLLLDENLSDRVIPRIVDLYPDSLHVKIGNSPTSKITQILKDNVETIAQFEQSETESILILA